MDTRSIYVGNVRNVVLLLQKGIIHMQTGWLPCNSWGARATLSRLWRHKSRYNSLRQVHWTPERVRKDLPLTPATFALLFVLTSGMRTWNLQIRTRYPMPKHWMNPCSRAVRLRYTLYSLRVSIIHSLVYTFLFQPSVYPDRLLLSVQTSLVCRPQTEGQWGLCVVGGAATGEQAQVASFLTWRPSPCLTSTAEVVVEEPSGAFLWGFFFLPIPLISLFVFGFWP